jgi:hypothetical protein
VDFERIAYHDNDGRNGPALTEYTQYSRDLTIELSPSEIAEMMGQMITTTLAVADGEMTAVAGAAAVMTSAAIMALAAPEYAGILRLAPLTVNVPVTTTAIAKPSPTPETPRLNYVEPERLVALGIPLTPPDEPVEVNDTPSQSTNTDSELQSPFVWPTHRPRPSHEAHGTYVNGTYTNSTAIASNSTNEDTSPLTNSTSARPHRGPTHNYTAVTTFQHSGGNVQKAPHNVTAVGPYRFPNSTSSLHGHGFANGTYRYPNGTYWLPEWYPRTLLPSHMGG